MRRHSQPFRPPNASIPTTPRRCSTSLSATSYSTAPTTPSPPISVPANSPPTTPTSASASKPYAASSQSQRRSGSTPDTCCELSVESATPSLRGWSLRHPPKADRRRTEGKQANEVSGPRRPARTIPPPAAGRTSERVRTWHDPQLPGRSTPARPSTNSHPGNANTHRPSFRATTASHYAPGTPPPAPPTTTSARPAPSPLPITLHGPPPGTLPTPPRTPTPSCR